MSALAILKRSLTGFCVFLAGCSGSGQDATEFEWHATESGPEHYPMEIRQGSFHYHDKSGGLYIPTGAMLYGGWGEMRSTHVTNGPKKKPLPDSFDIYFFSYTENQFYRGKFDLPYDKILSLFRAGYQENPDDPIYDGIMVGVAPGGAVSVWLNGYRTTEVFFGQAEKVMLNTSVGLDVPLDTQKEADDYVREVLADTLEPDEMASLKKNGVPFGTWARYRNLYKWAPAYKDGKISSDKEIYAKYLNGEKYRVPTIFSEEMANTPHPLPREMKFSVTLGNQSLYYIITFDEFELMDAFEKLGAHGERVYIEFDAQIPRQNMKIRVYNDKESIPLTKATIKE